MIPGAYMGSYTANTLHNRYGVKIVGVSDHTAAYYDPKGLPLPEINRYVEQHGVLTGFSSERRIAADEGAHLWTEPRKRGWPWGLRNSQPLREQRMCARRSALGTVPREHSNCKR